MGADQLLVFGLILAALAIPSAFAAFAEGRAPRLAAILLVAGGAMALGAVLQHPGAYPPRAIPEAFARVLAGVLR